jgi:hypothetical protein
MVRPGRGRPAAVRAGRAAIACGGAHEAGAVVDPTSVSYIGMFVQSRGFLPGAALCGSIGHAGLLTCSCVSRQQMSDGLR